MQEVIMQTVSQKKDDLTPAEKKQREKETVSNALAAPCAIRFGTHNKPVPAAAYNAVYMFG